MNLRWHIYQLVGIRDSSVVPAICFGPCNDAFIEAQRIGKTPALCTPDSPFMTSFGDCQNCVISHGDNSSNVSVFADAEFFPFIDFCSLAADSSNTSLISSQLSLLSAAATVQSVLSSKASAGSVLVVTQISTVVSISVSTVQGSFATPTLNPNSSPKLTPSSSSKAWIAGAVIGPLFVIFAITVALYFYRKRRRNKALNETMTATDDTDKKAGDGHNKAQLHGDSVAITRHELEGEISPEIVSELPALEPVGTELQVGKHN